eukprot:CAMPEP_0119008324 /NCGR_PEP_ID=MMETSP1176-20130426/3611_1 /TAXON_ID=265551 /ORGANISM="Synedropsis recta cf, Strain CCMP1620" /LENGTH=501 /DNA_ID=CAMNT_0006960635 /DNA_START=110 /DNA_END=1615 /DNA_ORIENTATION=+
MTFTRYLVAASLVGSPVVQGFVVTPTISSSARIQHRHTSSVVVLQSSPMVYQGGPANVTMPSPLFDDDTATTTTADMLNEAELWEQKQSLDALLLQSVESTFAPHTEQTAVTAAAAMVVVAPSEADAPSLSEEEQSKQDAIRNARLLLIGAAALYGTNFSFVKILGDIMPVGVSSTLRFGLAALFTLPWLIPKSNESKAAVIGATLGGLEVGMWNSIGYVAQAVGLETTDASKSAFICSLAVVVVPLLDFLFGKKLLPREIAGVVLAVLGVAVLELGGGADFELTSGDICSLIQPLAFGLGFWKMEKSMRKYPDHANRSTAAQLLAVFGVSGVYASIVGVPDMDQIMVWVHDPMILAALFWTGCITTALTVYMETLALKTLSAAETTLIFSTEPLWGAACASVVVGEQLGIPTAIGGALILGGCVYSNLGLDGIVSSLGLDGVFGNKKASTDSADPTAALLSSTMAGVGLASSNVAFALDEIEVDSLEILDEVIKGASDVL